jgi:acetyltransferase-like isoleucine patch superfamily enzyme
MKKLKRILCLIGNYLPPKLNCYFYRLAGVKFNPSKVWIGNKCYLDTMFPENIIIKDNVCISYGVTIVCHFDPSEGIKNHPIKKYKKKVIIEEGVFVGPNSTIMPGVTLKKNSFIMAGTIVSKSTCENSVMYGNPQKQRKKLTKKLISKLNNQNKKYNF